MNTETSRISDTKKEDTRSKISSTNLSRPLQLSERFMGYKRATCALLFFYYCIVLLTRSLSQGWSMLPQPPVLPDGLLGHTGSCVFVYLPNHPLTTTRSYSERCLSPSTRTLHLNLVYSTRAHCAGIYRWLPAPVLIHCINHTRCKLLILDNERADLLGPSTDKLVHTSGYVVLSDDDNSVPKWTRSNMRTWTDMLNSYAGPDPRKVAEQEILITPEDNATIMFTSGTLVAALALAYTTAG